MSITVPTNIFLWTWPEEFVDAILVHALHLNVMFLYIHDDAMVSFMVIIDNTPLPYMIKFNGARSPCGVSLVMRCRELVRCCRVTQSCLFELKTRTDQHVTILLAKTSNVPGFYLAW
jgi:hypothetical protein